MPDRPHLENASYLVENAAWVRYWYATAILNWPTNLTLFLFGLLAGRKELLVKLAGSPRTLVAIALCGVAAGAALFFAEKALDQSRWGLLRSVVFTLHCWGMSSAYVATLLLALRTSAGVAILTPLSAIGRMALTNYLGQAGMIVPLCLAFGWFDKFTPTTSLALALAVFLVVQLPFSILWLKLFEFGPAEWVWRMFTYGHVPSLRRGIAVGHG
jgi:uncharacterized protein